MSVVEPLPRGRSADGKLAMMQARKFNTLSASFKTTVASHDECVLYLLYITFCVALIESRDIRERGVVLLFGFCAAKQRQLMTSFLFEIYFLIDLVENLVSLDTSTTEGKRLLVVWVGLGPCKTILQFERGWGGV